METCKHGSEGGNGKRTETYLASCLPYLHKGSKVLIEGKLHPDPKTGRPEIWTRQDGSAAADYNVTVKELYFLDSKNGNGGGQNEPPATDEEVDIPF